MPGILKQKRTILTLFVTLIICFSLDSQVYQFRNYGLEEGIPHRWVYTLNQEPSGYIWVGTGTDLARFDGFEFISNPTRDSLPDDFVIKSFKDSKGRIWFGHDRGSVSMLENNRIKVLDNPGLHTRITSIMEDNQGNILVASQQNGILVVDKEMNITIYQDPFKSISITSMAADGENRLLIGTFEGLLLYNYSPGSEPEKTGPLTILPPATIACIEMFDEKSIFVGTREHGLFHLTPGESGSYTVTNVGSRYGMGNANVQSVYADNNHNLWISTWGNGVYKISNYFAPERQAGLTRFTTQNGLAANFVYGILQDTEGNYWFNTFDGLSLLVDESFSFFPRFAEPFGKNVLSVYSDNESIWLGGESGLISISKKYDGTYKYFGTQRGLPFDLVTAITTCDDRNIWIGTAENGIFKLSTDTQKADPFYVSANSLENTINDLECNEMTLLAATNSGIFEFNIEADSSRRYSTNEGLPHNLIRSIYTDTDGVNWISTRSNRLVNVNNKREIGIAGIEIDFVAAVQDNKGRFWTATTRNGIIKAHNDSIVQLTTDEGLHSNFCYSIIKGDDGNIWVGHRLGLSKVDPDTYFVRTYGTESGITGDFNHNAVHRTDDGKLLFGTTEGLVSYDPSKVNRRQTAPILNITSVEISDEPYGTPEKIALSYGSYKVRIEFIGLNYSDPEKVLYQYKLEGYDLDWSDLSDQRYAYYSRLDDGDFEFLLRAYNAEGIISEQPLRLVITIEKPIWKRWYFFLFILLLFGIILLSFIKIRERNLRIEKERIEKELAIRTKEVIEQKVEIEHKNRDITDSINYAQRIQASILPPVSKMKENFSDAFVFYQPRDIVSGDFYWFDKVTDDKFLIVCADSTGHGVPGAFMSMIGTTLIKDICMRPNVNSPSVILETLDREITSTLNQNDDSKGKSTDGMDITVCEFDLRTNYLRFASAMRPIMLLYKGELTYVRGSRNSIGGYYTEHKEFENKGFQLDPGDVIYLFSDGYPDQFGGPLGKKYKIGRLKNHLLDICHNPMTDQYEHIKNTFNLWKDGHEQVDDVLFMGIKI